MEFLIGYLYWIGILVLFIWYLLKHWKRDCGFEKKIEPAITTDDAGNIRAILKFQIPKGYDLWFPLETNYDRGSQQLYIKLKKGE